MAVGKKMSSWKMSEIELKVTGETYGTKTGGNLVIVVLVGPTNEKRK